MKNTNFINIEDIKYNRNKKIEENRGNTDKYKLERNIKLYKKYKMVAYDWVFFYAISVLYFTITKGFSTAQVMYISAFYTLFFSLLQLPAHFMEKKLGLKTSMIIGNAFSMITMAVYIFAKDFKVFMGVQFFNALAFVLKNSSESSLMCSSLKRLDAYDKFDKIEGTANSRYYFLEGISAIIAGFLFNINEYIPVIICLLITIISFYISFKFYDVSQEVSSDDKKSIKRLFVEFFDMLSINRLKSIFLVGFIFSGIIYASVNLYKLVLINLNINTNYITIIICFFTVFAGIGSKFQFKLQKLLKNQTLTVYSKTFIICLGILGIFGIIGILNLFTLSCIMLCLCIMGTIQGAYKVAMRRYTLSFTTFKIRGKISSVYYMFEYLGTTIITFSVGFLLEIDNINSQVATVIVAIISFAIMEFVLKYIDGKLGLKPEQYDKKEINNIEV